MGRAAPVVARVPGDKSITHRALILSAVADGQSRLEGVLAAADTRATARALRALGVDVADPGAGPIAVRGVGLHGLSAPDAPIDCGNSGTTARLLLGLLAGCGFPATLTGDDSLRRRPMRRVTAPLARSGATFEELGPTGRLPIRVHGTRPVSPIDHINDPSSAQVKSALILAGLAGGGGVTVRERPRSRDHTERMLRGMGVAVIVDSTDDGAVVRVDPVEGLEPLIMTVPGDFSSAAFFLALGALHRPIRVSGVGLNPTRTGMLRVLERMGADVATEIRSEAGGEPVGDVTVGPGGELRGTIVAHNEVPALLDEVPVIAAIAATIPHETRFEGVAELRVKESDRIQAVGDNLRSLGVETEAGADYFVVRGTRRPLRGEVDAFGDHRIAMAFGVLAALPGNRIFIRGRDAVSISYPTFWKELERVSSEMEEQ